MLSWDSLWYALVRKSSKTATESQDGLLPPNLPPGRAHLCEARTSFPREFCRLPSKDPSLGESLDLHRSFKCLRGSRFICRRSNEAFRGDPALAICRTNFPLYCEQFSIHLIHHRHIQQHKRLPASDWLDASLQTTKYSKCNSIGSPPHAVTNLQSSLGLQSHIPAVNPTIHASNVLTYC